MNSRIKSAIVKSEKRKRSVDREVEREIKQESKRRTMSTNVVQFIGKIEHFTAGDDFKDYMDRMEHIYEINNVKTENKISLLVSVGGPDLFRIIKLVAAPKKPKEYTYAELVTALNNYFEPKRNTIGERFIFHRRQQSADESVGDFIVEIKSLSQNCDFGTHLNEALRDKLIFGVSSTKIQRRLVNEKELDFDKACEIARTMEATEDNLAEMQKSDTIAAIGRSRNNFNGKRQVFSRLGANGNEKKHDKAQRQRFTAYKCYLCGKLGHIVRNCYSNPNRVNRDGTDRNCVRMNAEENESETSINSGMNHINSVLAGAPLLLEVRVNQIQIKMEIDTGACKTVMHVRDFKKKFPRLELEVCNSKLFSVSGQPLNIIGVCTVLVGEFEGDRTAQRCKFIIVGSPRSFTPLLGRDWLDNLYPQWRDKLKIKAINTGNQEISKVKETVEQIKTEFATVFTNIAAGTIKHFKAKFHLCEDAKPIFFKPYTVPYGLREAVEAEINRLCDLGIIYPVRHSVWASPVVIVNKADGSIRMCVDCKVTINKYLQADHYPLPRIDDILASLANAKYFCVLDLREAYAQMEVAEECQQFLTINTHMGLYRYKRLIFGVSSAPTIFQSMMDQIIQGLLWVICFIDDLLIGGNTSDDCIQNVRKCLTRLNEYNVKVKWEKCKFFEKSVTYLGHEISEDGIRPNPEKIREIVDAPQPENLTQVKSYLGLLNYYGRFIPNLSQESMESYKLTQMDMPFVWSPECQNAFDRSKQLLLSNKLLVHYDPSKPIVIHCDASPYGLGAILSHVIDGKDKPVLFTSCTLTKTQQNYAQLHREALAIVFAVKKFHKYIFGKPFVIYSDHQPLQEIFNEKKSMPIATGRLQRWAIFLAMYNYHIEYKKGSKLGNADALSRLPLSIENDIETQNVHAFAENKPISTKEVAAQTRSDKCLWVVYEQLFSGWKYPINKSVRPFYNKRTMLSIENECIFYGNRIVIPERLTNKILSALHETHIGVCRMKASARHYVWWPNIDRDIEAYARQCRECQLMQASPSKTELSKWKETNFFLLNK